MKPHDYQEQVTCVRCKGTGAVPRPDEDYKRLCSKCAKPRPNVYIKPGERHDAPITDGGGEESNGSVWPYGFSSLYGGL
ncbi:MAG: hypothetical protein AAGE80_05485 [Pseudomonadota bacterium]